jgi:hypothetical protein
MGWVHRLLHITPKEELKGISLNFTVPFWKLEGKTDFPSLFCALRDLLPDGCILYFEGGYPRGRLLEFFNAKAIPEQTHVAVGTFWPRPDYYHIPATTENLTALAQISESYAEAEIAIHFHVYRNGNILLEWHDAFSQPMLLSGELSEQDVRTFAEALSMKITKSENAGEQANQPDRE